MHFDWLSNSFHLNSLARIILDYRRKTLFDTKLHTVFSIINTLVTYNNADSVYASILIINNNVNINSCIVAYIVVSRQ